MFFSVAATRTFIGARTKFLRLTFWSFIFILFGAAAQAQDVDWLLNLDDTGVDPSPAGGAITYDITVTNDGFGPANAPATTLSIDIPANTRATGFSGTITGCSPVPLDGPATLICDVPTLAPNGTVATLDLDIVAAQQGTISINASVPTGGDSNPANNTDSEGTTITQGADLSLAVQGPATAASGSIVTYDFIATNAGPDAVSDVVVSFPVPTGLNNVVPPTGCTLASGTYTCTIAGPIAVGASSTISFDGQVSAAAGSTLTPLASITGGSIPDPNTADNTGSVNTSVTGGSDVSLSKSRAPSGSLLVGDPAVFTLAAQYTGDNPTDLTITDTIPANYAIDSVTTTGGWVCTTVGQVVECTLTGGSGAGSDVSLGSVTINTTILSAGTPTNTANISATGPADPNTANNSDTDGGATIVEPTVDLRANKSGPNPPLVVVGNPYDYVISATNDGTADFFGTLVLTDNLPAGLRLTSYVEPAGWSCSPPGPIDGPATLTCERTYTVGAPLTPGETSTAVTLQTEVLSAGSINNILTVSSPDSNIVDTNAGNDTTTVTVTGSSGTNSADISVIKTAAVDPVVIGQTQTFSLEVVNAGPEPSLNVVLTDDLTQLVNNQTGAGNGVVSFTAPAGFSCSTASSGGLSRELTCTAPSLAVCTPGSCPVISVDVTLGGDSTSRSNTADVISNGTADPDLTNNSSTVSFVAEQRADVQMTKVGSPSPATAGQNLTYVLTALNTNNGLSSAANVTVTDTLPADLTFISASPSAGSCSVTPTANSTTLAGSNNMVTCNVGTVANGAQQTVTIVVRPNLVTRGTSLVNSASISTSTTETDGTNNTASATIPVQNPVLDLLVNKTETVDPVAIGDDTTYIVTVQNLGPSASENIVVTDLMPTTGLSFQSFTIDQGGSCSSVPAVNSTGGNLTCEIPLLTSGQTATLSIVARGVTKGTVANNVGITSDEIDAGFDSSTGNNNQSENTTVRTRADVEVASKVATPNPVNLRDDFNFVITVQNNAGPGRSEADDVEVTDSLPQNMVLTGTPTVVVTSGTATLNSCTGTAGQTSFTCELGTFSTGAVAEITVPVEVIAVNSLPQVFSNTATISTSSLDEVPANNTNSGTVSVSSSSISGNVFRDFNADDAITAGDSGIGGVTITLTGTDIDGNAVSETVTTAADGTYTFDFVPAGTYTVTRGAFTESFLTDGTNSAGTAGGTPGSTSVTSGIVLPADTAATGYLFPAVPQARIGIAKAVQSGPTANADGSFNVTFRLLVENLSFEQLDNIVVTDPLQGAAPLFGTNVTLGTPATDPMTAGTYTMLSTPSGTCGGVQAGFNGAGAQSVTIGSSVASGATCFVDIALRVQPTVPLPGVRASGGRYENQATVTGEGVLSGQTSATNPELSDASDNGSTTDANGDGSAGGSGENDPTPVAPLFDPEISLIKTADTSALSTPPQIGEQITYRFAITNTGDVTLTDITIFETLAGVTIVGGPIASLTPGASDTVTITATYAITQANIDAGQVTNSAVVTGSDPFNRDVTDTSGTTNGDNDPLVTPLSDVPGITLVKTPDASGVQSPAMIGDTISYAFTVTNTGNVTLSNVVISDPLPGIVLSGGPIVSLAPGVSDGTTFTATYQLVQADLDNGNVTNQATATGTPPSGPPVTDLSGSNPTNDTPSVTPLDQFADIELVKSSDDSAFLTADAVPGDTIPYSFAITNTGLETLLNVTVADLLPGLVLSGNPIASLAPGVTDNTSITGLYTITAADVAAGEVNNTATVTGNYTDGGGNPQTVTDTSTDQAILTPIRAVTETFPAFTTDGGTSTSILASDMVRNTQATLANVVITVLAEDSGVTLDPNTGLITLAPGNPAGRYNVTYQICDVLSPTVCDTAIETVVQLALPALETTKTQAITDNGDGVTGVGDTVTYTITVENTGNVVLENVSVADDFATLAGSTLSLDTGPTYVTATNGSAEGDLILGEVATYTATYVLTIQAVTEGGLTNIATASGDSVIPAGVPGTPTTVDDVSDNGVDTDGNSVDDPTVLSIVPSLAAAGLTLTKTTPVGNVTRGSTVPYTITIQNDNVVVAGNFNVVDVLPAGFLYVPGSSTLDGVAFTTIVSGRTITWPALPIPPLSTVTLTLMARVTDGANPGEHVNTVSVRNPLNGALLPPAATATVRIAPEAVFDCGDVIGKVFDDRNRDGYQNPFKTDKDGAVLGDNPNAEPGIPAARLVGVDGTIITTDQFGRFHVPCAMLPDDRGSNFILKLDTRSLPSGFRLTTENPRVVRLTPGKLTEMNFGAAITQVVRVDLNSAAFTPNDNGTVTLAPNLVAGINQLLPRIADTPVNLRLAYHLPKSAGREETERGRKYLKSVERYIRREWRDIGQVKLTIERTFVRSGQ